LVKAIRTRAESAKLVKCSISPVIADMDDEDCEIKHLHFLSNDYVLKRGVCFAPNSVTAQCNTDECVQETFIDLEAELAEY
jgi:hypothetical protein